MWWTKSMELRVRLLLATGCTPIMAHPRAFVAGSDIVGFVLPALDDDADRQRPQDCRMHDEVEVALRPASATAHTPKTVHPQRTRRSRPATHTQQRVAGYCSSSRPRRLPSRRSRRRCSREAVSHELIYRVMLYALSRNLFDRSMFHRLGSHRPIQRPRPSPPLLSRQQRRPDLLG
jgi:hypothetical protein